MTLYEFNALPEKDKEIATMNGDFLADRRDAGLTIALYAVSDFYVELTYDSQANAITGLNSFRSLQRLAPYLAQVKFDQL